MLSFNFSILGARAFFCSNKSFFQKDKKNEEPCNRCRAPQKGIYFTKNRFLLIDFSLSQLWQSVLVRQRWVVSPM